MSSEEGQGRKELTERETQVMNLLAEGKKIKEIAGIIGVSVKTAEAHKYNLMKKIGANDTSSVVMPVMGQAQTTDQCISLLNLDNLMKVSGIEGELLQLFAKAARQNKIIDHKEVAKELKVAFDTVRDLERRLFSALELKTAQQMFVAALLYAQIKTPAESQATNCAKAAVVGLGATPHVFPR